MNLLTPLQKIQGKPIPKGAQAKCPIHEMNGRITDWKPPSGIDPLLREFRCNINQHAFYMRIKHDNRKT